jgi:hypothetical protein
MISNNNSSSSNLYSYVQFIDSLYTKGVDPK